MTTTLTLQTSAAQALVAALPTTSALTPLASVDRPLNNRVTAFTAVYVGALSADIALTLNGAEGLVAAAGTGAGSVSVADVLRPAFEAAAALLGVGVLGEIRQEDATALYSDPETVVFELFEGASLEGTFAVRVRDTGSAPVRSLRSGSMGSEKLSRINNVEMSLTVEIGRTRLSVRDVLDLEPGGVIELDRSAGAPADVLLNGRLIAQGEVVVVDQDYAVRITKILDVTEGTF